MDFREESFLNGFSDGLEKIAGPRAAAKKGASAVSGFLKKQLGKVTAPAKSLRAEMRWAGPATGKPLTGRRAAVKRYAGRVFTRGGEGKRYRKELGGAALRVGAAGAGAAGLGAALKKRKKED